MMIPRFLQAVFLPVTMLVWTATAQAADRAHLREFLEVTGFDVAIASMQQGAMAGPALAGATPDEFGADWTRLAELIFDPDSMIDRAVDMMEAVMPDELIDHGIAFYGSELGQRLVAVENMSHMEDPEVKAEGGDALIAMLSADDPARLEQLRDLSRATGSSDTSIRAIIEVQLRYLVAASRAGIIRLRVDETELRLMLQSQIDPMRTEVEKGAVRSAAWAYRDISTEDLKTYTQALEDPSMRAVYEVLNAVQFELMAERYERLADALSDLHPQQDI
ncbi:DUF2059 domain-containing protein [Aliiroseovarius sp.]|uniref:DUF2059 domain-containing protein n=1 Tax=Aliiroseovarius sp. TaxID=1872442 RepID=UPI002611E026|nr:DUF2059 domain-containing protein [Aliiroseovarius sp.]